jgi:hypothetical protein
MKNLSKHTVFVALVTVMIALAFSSCSKGSSIVDPTETHQENGTN